MNYRSVDDLNRTIVENLHRIPDDVDLIVGVPRSGMLPATLLALYCNRPLTNDAALLAAEDIVTTANLDPVASPTDALSTLLSTSTLGVWTLTIIDFANGQTNFTFPTWTINVNESVAPVPVPAAAWLFLSGVSWLGLMRRRTGRI